MDPPVAVVGRVRDGVPLVVGAQGLQQQVPFRHLRHLPGVTGEQGLAHGGGEDALVDRVRQPDASRACHPPVQVVQPGHDPGDPVADRAVVGLELLPREVDPAVEGAAGGRAQDGHLAEQELGRGLQPPPGGVHLAHRVLDRDELLPARLDVPFGPAQGRQDESGPPADGVGPVELGGDVGGQPTGAHGLLGDRAVGGGPDEVARDPQEDLDPAFSHRPDRVHRVQPVGAWRVEAEFPLQGVQEGVRHLFPDTHRAVALHIAVAAHRTGTRARPSQVPAQHQEVDDLPDGGDTVLVLGDSHGPADDDAFTAQYVGTDRLDLLKGQTGRGDHVVPGDLPCVLGELLEAARVGADEVVVQHLPRPLVLGFQQQPVQPLEEGQVTMRHGCAGTGRRSPRPARPVRVPSAGS